MKIASAFAATIIGLLGTSVDAAVIYDDFTTPATGLPNEDLWDISGSLSDISQSGGVLNMATHLYSVGIQSTASFGYGSFIFQFSDSLNTSYRGFGLVAGSSPTDDRILLRDDTLAGSLRLDVYTHGEAQISPTHDFYSFTYGPDDTWEFQYLPNQLVLIRNGITVFSQSVSLTTEPVYLSAFAYSGGSMRLDSVAVSPIPEPSTIALTIGVITAAGASTLLRRRRLG